MDTTCLLLRLGNGDMGGVPMNTCDNCDCPEEAHIWGSATGAQQCYGCDGCEDYAPPMDYDAIGEDLDEPT